MAGPAVRSGLMGSDRELRVRTCIEQSVLSVSSGCPTSSSVEPKSLHGSTGWSQSVALRTPTLGSRDGDNHHGKPWKALTWRKRSPESSRPAGKSDGGEIPTVFTRERERWREGGGRGRWPLMSRLWHSDSWRPAQTQWRGGATPRRGDRLQPEKNYWKPVSISRSPCLRGLQEGLPPFWRGQNNGF